VEINETSRITMGGDGDAVAPPHITVCLNQAKVGKNWAKFLKILKKLINLTD